MDKCFLIFCSFFLSFSCPCQSQNFVPTQTKHYFNWGGKTTTIVSTQYGKRKDIVMINLHDNETTSVEAAKKILSEKGGLLIQLLNDGERLLSFEKNKKEWKVDPNRIFTSRGMLQNLRVLNKHVPRSVLNSTSAFAKFILKRIPASAKTIITLHNNEDGKYSILSYTRGRSHAKDALKLFINPAHDPDDFFLVTRETIFKKLRSSGDNVVLQNNARAKDDGSLSIYYGRKNRNYINVEAEHDNESQQLEMLRDLLKFL